jgi:hypothetical protein
MMHISLGAAARTALCLAILAALPGCAQKSPATAASPVAAQPAMAQASAEPAEAKDILLRMAGFLAGAPRFSVVINDNYDVLQDSGQMIEFGETRRITVSRPDHLRVEVVHGDGERHFVLYDGRTITVSSPAQNVYAQAAKPGGIDAAVTYFLKDLHMRLPLAMLLLSRLPEEIQRRTETVDYVEKTEIGGKPVHHLAGRTDTVDYQIWVEEGSQPLPLRIVLTYRNAEGHPQFRAQFSDWNLSPPIQATDFAFKPPEGARKIAFLAELPPLEPQKGAATPNQTGGRK